MSWPSRYQPSRFRQRRFEPPEPFQADPFHAEAFRDSFPPDRLAADPGPDSWVAPSDWFRGGLASAEAVRRPSRPSGLAGGRVRAPAQTAPFPPEFRPSGTPGGRPTCRPARAVRPRSTHAQAGPGRSRPAGRPPGPQRDAWPADRRRRPMRCRRDRLQAVPSPGRHEPPRDGHHDRAGHRQPEPCADGARVLRGHQPPPVPARRGA